MPGTTVSKLVGKPVEVLKKVGKSVAEPAGKSNVYAIAGGVAISPLIGYGYGKLFDWVSGFVPNLPEWAKIIMKIAFPLIPVPIVYKTKIPAGGVINGTLIGMFFTNVFLTIYELITGKSLSTVIAKPSGQPSNDGTVSAQTTNFGVW